MLYYTRWNLLLKLVANIHKCNLILGGRENILYWLTKHLKFNNKMKNLYNNIHIFFQETSVSSEPSHVMIFKLCDSNCYLKKLLVICQFINNNISLNVLTYIITSMTAMLTGQAEILVIMSVSTFKIVVILYAYEHFTMTS